MLMDRTGIQWLSKVVALLLFMMMSVASAGAGDTTAEGVGMAFLLTSPAFKEGEEIPAKYTCEGQDISPLLDWTAPPQATKSFALIANDPDAPGKIWVHWVIFNIPGATALLRESFPSNPELPDGTRQGMTDFGRTGYGGPCPPAGTHRYYFTLYALDAGLDLPPSATANSLERAMSGHILGKTQLMGTYRRKRP